MNGSRSGRRGIAAAAAAFLCVLMLSLSSVPTAAYPFLAGGFADGSDTATLYFSPGVTELTGPSLHLLTNGTVSQASMVVAGRSGAVNVSTQETSTFDFLTNTLAENLSIEAGSIALGGSSTVVYLNVGNAWGNATLSGMVAAGDRLVLDNTTAGTFTSGVINAPQPGWGTLMASAHLPPGSNISASLLYPNGTLAYTPQLVGGVIPFNATALPALRVRITLTAASATNVTGVRWVTLGQQAGETLIGSGVTRVYTNPTFLPNGSLTIGSNPASFTRYGSNPVLQSAASTWYADSVINPWVMKNGSTWWMYFTGWDSSSPSEIGLATSSDGFSWTVGAAPVLTISSSGWDSGGVGIGVVIPDPSGSGYLMYYETGNGSITGISLATSPDGLNWTRYAGNPLITPSASGWDRGYVGGVSAVLVENGTYSMYYTGAAGPLGANKRAMGVATSTDGRNWTRYSGNPVLTRGGSGSYDDTDMARGGVVKVGSTYYFYYSADAGGSRGWRAALATSSDGLSFTKVGVVLGGSLASWETYGTLHLTVFLNADHMVMFYSGGSQYKIGRADSAWSTAVLRGTLDFGSNGPASFGAFSYRAYEPPGTSITIFLRSSADGTSWSASENVTTRPTEVSIPTGRYLEWTVYVRAGASASEAPVFESHTLGFFALIPIGRYESSSLVAPDLVSGVTVAVYQSDTRGSLAIEVSDDNGSSWTRVVNNTYSPLGLTGTTVRYALILEAGAAGGPIVDDVIVTTQRRGFPEDVTVRLGVAGNPWFNVSGIFDIAVNVSIPADGLNAIIAATLAQFPTATAVDVPLVVTSSHFGHVELSQFRVTQQLKNPLSVTFSPAAAAFAMDENTTATFGAAYAVFPANLKVNTTWSLDASPLPSQRDQLQYNYSTDFSSAGNHTLTMEVENGDFNFSHTWNITVWNVNRPPAFTFAAPNSPVRLSHTASLNFTAIATDPDAEALAYRWELDSIPVTSTATTVTVGNLAPGLHSLSAFVSDAYETASWTWTITSTNSLPQVTSRDPPSDFDLSHSAARVVSVVVVDTDGEPLAYQWRLDGEPIANATGPMARLSALPVGAHTLSLTVRDMYGSAMATWTVTSTNAGPRVSSAIPAGDPSASHTAAIDFVAAFADLDGDPLQVRWFVDGSEAANGTLRFTLDPVGLGERAVVVQADDGLASVSHVWNVTGTNDGPVVVAFLPAQNLTASVAEAVSVAVEAMDADGDSINYAWRLGMLPLPWSEPNVTVGPLGDGNHELSVTVSDGRASAIFVFRLTVKNFAPVIIGANPTTDFVMRHNTTRVVSVTALDREGDPITYQWSIDSRVLGEIANELTLAGLAAGDYRLRLVVRDGISQTERTWNVTVVNAPPVFVDVSPQPGDVMIDALEEVSFSARAADPDGDPVVLRWSVNNKARNVSGKLTLQWASRGTHQVTVDAVSVGHVVTVQWNVTVVQVNAAPVLRGSAPNTTDVAVTVGSEGVFAVEYDDDGVLPVEITWTVDGVERGSGAGFVFRPRGADVGSHELRVRITDGEFAVEHTWTVLVSEPAETTGAGSLGDVLPLLVGLVVGAGAAAGLVLFLRRRPPRAKPSE